MKSRRMILVSLATIGALFAPAFVRAAEDEPADAVRMSLNECLSRALEHNFDLVIAQKDPEIAKQNVTFQKAAFDPALGAGLTHTAVRTEQITQIDPGTLTATAKKSSSRSINDAITANLTQKLSFGASYTVSANGATSPPLSSSIFNQNLGIQINSQTDRPKDWGYGLNFRLPFLRGFGPTVNEASLLIAKHDVNISDRELRRRAEVTIKSVEDAYWNLLAAREAQKVAEQALQLAQQLYELNKKKVDVGTLAPIEITQAEANVASNVEGTIRTKEAVRNSEDVLRGLLAVPREDRLWTATIIPTETPFSEPISIDEVEAIRVASEHRAEIANAREQIEVSKLSEAAAQNGVMHQLDLNAGWSRSRAESGSSVSYAPPSVFFPPHTYESVGRTSPDWSVGLTYAYPIGNRAAKSSYAIAKLNREKSETTLESVMQDVLVDVRTAVRAVTSGYERVTAGRKNVELQTKKLDAEQKKFDNGMSTSFEVFTFQTDLRNAQLSLIQALLDYNKSLADLERAKGTLLESKGLKLAADAGR